MSEKKFVPFIAPDTIMKEFTLKAVVTGAAFGIIFGAATVYLALKAGLTVSASIPIAVMSIALSKLFLQLHHYSYPCHIWWHVGDLDDDSTEKCFDCKRT